MAPSLGVVSGVVCVASGQLKDVVDDLDRTAPPDVSDKRVRRFLVLSGITPVALVRLAVAMYAAEFVLLAPMVA
jgi:hypothetical protein